MGVGPGRKGYDWGLGGQGTGYWGRKNMSIDQPGCGWVLRALINIVIIIFQLKLHV